MAFGRYTLSYWWEHLPRITSYEQALKIYENTVPVRGDAEQRRPLGRRRDKYIHIKEDSDSIICCYGWGKDNHIIFKKDGRIIVGGTWRSTRRFLTAVLGADVKIVQGMWICCDVPGAGEGWLRLNQNKVFRFVDGKLMALKPEYPIRYTLDRKALNGLRKQYEPFINYLRSNAKLRGQDGYTAEELEDLRGLDDRRFWNRVGSTDHQKYYEAFLCLVKHNSYEMLQQPNGWRCPSDKAKFIVGRFKDKLLRDNKNQLFKKEEVTTLKIFKDPYAWAGR